MYLFERLIKVIDYRYPKRGAFTQLAKESGISSNMWSHIYHGRVKPHGEHLEHICQRFPEYSLWLMTEQTNAAAGQSSPDLDQLNELQKTVSGK